MTGVWHHAWFMQSWVLNSGFVHDRQVLCPLIYLQSSSCLFYGVTFLHMISLQSIFFYMYLFALCAPLLESLFYENAVSFFFKMEYSRISLAGFELLGTMILWPQVLGMLGPQCLRGKQWQSFVCFLFTDGTTSSKIEIGRLWPKGQI